VPNWNMLLVFLLSLNQQHALGGLWLHGFSTVDMLACLQAGDGMGAANALAWRW